MDQLDAEQQIKVPAGAAYVYDDFRVPSRHWQTWTGEHGSIEIKNGFLYFSIKEPNFDFWSLNGSTYWDTVTAVDSEFLGGPGNNTYGIICRFQDEKNFYQFVISDDGYGGILKVENGQYINLTGEDGLRYGEMIQKGEGKNLLRADCVGDELKLVVNQQELVTVKDQSFKQGKVGVVAGTSEPGELDLSFDNFTIVKP